MSTRFFAMRRLLTGAQLVLALFALLACLALAAFGQASIAQAAEPLTASDIRTTSTAKSSSNMRDAQLVDGVYTLSSALRSTTVLEIAGGSSASNASVQAWRQNYTPAQRWRITRTKDGYYKVVNVKTGKALGVSGRTVRNGTAVQQNSWKNTKSQKWQAKKDSSGYLLMSALSPKYVLCFNGGKIENGTIASMHKIRSGKAYRMRLTRIAPAVKDGAYKLICTASSKPLQVTAGMVADGANVQQGSKGTTLDRTFLLSYDERTGYYRILSPASGLALDVAGGQNANRANVQLYSINNSDAQRWAVLKKRDGTFAIRSATGGKALDIADASTLTGANAQLFTFNHSSAQAWRLRPLARWLPDGDYTFANCKSIATVISVAGGSKNTRANVQMETRSNSKAQKWSVVYRAKAGAYTIRNKSSRLMLEVKGAATNNANVRQNKATGKKNQLWIPKAASGGICFVSAANPKVMLGIANASKSAGANIAVFSKDARAIKKFRLRDASIPVFKVYLNPGHGWNSNNNGAYDTGAQGNGYSEADFTHDLARRVQAYCESYGIEVVNGEQFELAYWERLPMAVSLGCDVMVSIHFDWSGAGRSGTHTMVGVQGKAPGSDLLNDIIHRHLVAATGLPDLGTTYRSDITAVNGPIPAMLMEVCFMDSAYDVSVYLSRQDEIARAIADGIFEASQQAALR